jgi:LEA14-like dessication related protein
MLVPGVWRSLCKDAASTKSNRPIAGSIDGVTWSTLMFSPAHAVRLLALTLLLLALGGCSWLRVSDYQEPEVRLLKVQVVKARLLQQDLRLYFRVDNPNDRSVLVRGLRYRVMLNEVALAEGEWSEWFVVEGDSHGNFVVPVRTNLWRHAKYLAALLKKPDEAIHYRLEGKLKTGFLFRHNVLIGRDGEIIPKDLIAE